MKSILLSFKPRWADLIMTGVKIYEYRKRFCDEPVMAYMYVSRPEKKVCGILYLDQKIALNDLLLKYRDNVDVRKRVENYMQRNNYMIPILQVHSTNVISLEEIQKVLPEFRAPQMYYDLDNNPHLKNFLKENIRIDDVNGMTNDFGNIDDQEICRFY